MYMFNIVLHKTWNLEYIKLRMVCMNLAGDHRSNIVRGLLGNYEWIIQTDVQRMFRKLSIKIFQEHSHLMFSELFCASREHTVQDKQWGSNAWCHFVLPLIAHWMISSVNAYADVTSQQNRSICMDNLTKCFKLALKDIKPLDYMDRIDELAWF